MKAQKDMQEATKVVSTPGTTSYILIICVFRETNTLIANYLSLQISLENTLSNENSHEM